MSADDSPMAQRLPFLLEQAAELGVPVEVRPDIQRVGPEFDRVVSSARITVHADIGTMPPNVHLGAEILERLAGSWLEIAGAQDLELAANLRRRRVFDVAVAGPPDEVRTHAQTLRDLFDRDQQLAIKQNAAQDQLRGGLDQLTSGLSAEALQAIYGPQGPDLGLSGERPPVLAADQPVAALERAAYEIRSGFVDYQRFADERRMVAADAGEATVRLERAITAAGRDDLDASTIDVDALIAGRWT